MVTLASDPGRADEVAEVLKALGHPVRLRIVSVLCTVEEAHVSGLMGCLELPQTTISQQLRLLRAHGVVDVRREEGFAWYRLAMPTLREVVAHLEDSGFLRVE